MCLGDAVLRVQRILGIHTNRNCITTAQCTPSHIRDDFPSYTKGSLSHTRSTYLNAHMFYTHAALHTYTSTHSHTCTQAHTNTHKYTRAHVCACTHRDRQTTHTNTPVVLKKRQAEDRQRNMTVHGYSTVTYTNASIDVCKNTHITRT